MNPQLQTLLRLLSFVAIGRVALSVLPAGWPGRHDRSELGVTLATSFLLGMLVFVAQGALATRLDLGLESWWLFLPWIVLGAARVALLPAGLRPRHEPPAARAGALARAGLLLGWIVWLALVARLWQEWDVATAFDTTSAPLAGAALAVAGLERARRSPGSRSLAWLVLAGIAFVAGGFPLVAWSWIAAFLALGLTGTIAWLRRADRRGLALAVLGYTGIGMTPNAALIGLAGLVVLVACTPAASRRRALGWSLAAGAVVALLLFICFEQWTSMARLRPHEHTGSWVWIVPAMALPMTVVWVRLARPARGPEAVEPPRRELVACGATLSLAVAGAALGDAAGGWPVEEVSAALLPAAVVFLLLAFAPSERGA